MTPDCPLSTTALELEIEELQDLLRTFTDSVPEIYPGEHARLKTRLNFLMWELQRRERRAS